MSVFCDSWKFESCKNFDNYLKELGINVVLRKLAAAAKPTVIISKKQMEGEEEMWTVKTDTLVKSATAFFWMNSSFTETTIDDREVDSLWTVENGGNSLVNVQTDKAGRVARVERTIHEDIMNVTMYVNNVVSYAVFKRAKRKPQKN